MILVVCRRPYCAILCYFVRKPKVSGDFSNNPRSCQVYAHPPTHPHQTQHLPHQMCNVLCEGISSGNRWSNMIQFLKPCIQLDSICIPMSTHWAALSSHAPFPGFFTDTTIVLARYIISCIKLKVISVLSTYHYSPTAQFWVNIMKQCLGNQVRGTMATSLAIWLPRPPWSSTPHRRDPRVHRKWPDLATNGINCSKSLKCHTSNNENHRAADVLRWLLCVHLVTEDDREQSLESLEATRDRKQVEDDWGLADFEG